jgi:hypothetical protein
VSAHELALCDTTGGVTPHGSIDFVISLAARHPGCTNGWLRDPSGQLGPSNLPVDGTIRLHAAVFLHELGHALSLGHGGGDALNHKPNYLSLMNYAFAVDGVQFDIAGNDGIADLLPTDRNMNGQPDPGWYMFSNQVLPTLDEGSLDEPAGIADGNAITFYGPVECDLDGDGVCDMNCGGACPGPTCLRWAEDAVGDARIDWNRDGDTDDLAVSTLASPPFAPGTTTDINRSDNCQVDPALVGFNDWFLLRDGGLARVNPAGSGPSTGISKEVYDRLQSTTRRVRDVPDQAFMEERCEAVRAFGFEDVSLGGFAGDTYAPAVTFPAPPAPAAPEVVGPPGRNGLPTQSPEHSMTNGPASGGVPMVIEFDPPQRFVGLYRGITADLERPGTFFMEAYDAEDRPMGATTRPITTTAAGITEFVGLAAILNGHPIARVVLSDDIQVPIHVDDLVICEELTPADEQPDMPDEPVYGKQEVTIGVESAAIFRGEPDPDPESADEDGTPYVPLTELPIVDVSITVDGEVSQTAFTHTATEGSLVSLSAPKNFEMGGIDFAFLMWREDDTTQYPMGQETIAYPMNRAATVIAVYLGEPDDCACAEGCDGDNPGSMAMVPFLVGLVFLARRRRT